MDYASRIFPGIISGLIATVVISAIMVMKQAMGIMPGLDPVGMLSDAASQMLGIPHSPVVGWMMHFAIGALAWGLAFALIQDRLPFSGLGIRGIVFGIAAWLGMMLVVMPMMGAGFFGLAIGIGAPLMTLMIHIVYGLALALAYRRLAPE